ELHPLVLAAKALVILDRAKDTRAEQPVTFGLEGTIVDGLRLLDLAKGPGQDTLGACQTDPDFLEGLRGLRLVENVGEFLVHVFQFSISPEFRGAPAGPRAGVTRGPGPGFTLLRRRPSARPSDRATGSRCRA